MPGRILRNLFGGAAQTVGANAGRATRTAADVNASAAAHNVATRRITHDVATKTRAANRARRTGTTVGGRAVGSDLVPFSGTTREPSIFDRLLGSEGSVRRKYTTRGLYAGGGVMGASMGMNAVLGPRPPSAGRQQSMMSPGGTGLPY